MKGKRLLGASKIPKPPPVPINFASFLRFNWVVSMVDSSEKGRRILGNKKIITDAQNEWIVFLCF